MRFVLGVATTLVVVYGLLCILVWLGQRSLIYHPQPRQAGIESTVLESGGERLVVTTRAADGPDALVYFGGNAEDVARSLPGLARAFPSHALYLMHYRGYGGSTGSPSEAALVADGLALFDRVRRDHARVAVVGRSLGSGVAMQVASQRPVARVVLVTPYESLLALGRERFPWLPVRWLMRDRFDSASHAPAVTAPTLIVVAEHDDIVPVASSEALLAKFHPGVARLVRVAGSDHVTIADRADYGALIGAGP